MRDEVRIRHCHIEARARGSGLAWADADARRAFAGRVQALVLGMLEELLAPALARLGPAGVPLMLALDLKLDARDLTGAAPLARTHLRDRMIEAIAAAMPAGPAAEPEAAARPPAIEAPSWSRRRDRPRPLDLLLSWREARQLEYRLALLSGEALAMLLDALLADLSESGPSHPGTAAPIPASRREGEPRPPLRSLRAPIERLVRAAAAARAPAAGRLEAARLARAVAAAERAARPGRTDAERPRGAAAAPEAAPEGARRADPPGVADRSPRPAGRRPAPSPPGPKSGAPAAGRAAPVPAASAAPRPRRAAPSPIPAPLPPAALGNGRHELDSVLPLLALQPLARHGIFDAIAALGDAAESASLAFAVALRTLAPAEAGGRWSAAQQAAAAACAGLDAPIDGAGLAAAARGAGAICDLAGSAVAATLIAGHRPGLPLPLLGDAGRLVLFESEGLYPLGRMSGSLVASAFAGRGETFFLADPDPALLAEVDAAGLGAAAPGPPVRGDSWTAVNRRGWRGMTNLPPDRAASAAPHLPAAERSALRAAEIWRALTVERPLLPDGAADPAFLLFDRAAALLAGFALADIAWTLFGRDPAAWAEPDPLLAGERFADLSGTLVVTPGEAVLTLPLGARFADLRDAGLLATLRGVPWWPGRILSFRGG